MMILREILKNIPEYAGVLCVGAVLDLLIGDPQNWWHPVRSIGWLISFLEKKLRAIFPKTEGGELVAGGVLAVLVPAVSVFCAWLVLCVAGWIHPNFRLAVMAVMCGQLLAGRSLRDESMKVCRALQNRDVEGARYAVSMIVGRDTKPLSEEGITKAAIETVAENASDGVIAPMMWMFFFGPLGGFFYKAVNTLDSMVGYKNDRYLYFGRVSAHLDDVVNWIPARFGALCFVVGAWILPGYDGKSAWKIWRRDRHCHKSPNSAQGESACAGALGLRLAGDAWYFGKLVKKPFIGDETRHAEAQDIIRVNRLMMTASFLALIAGVGGMLWIRGFMAGF